MCLAQGHLECNHPSNLQATPPGKTNDKYQLGGCYYDQGKDEMEQGPIEKIKCKSDISYKMKYAIYI